MVDRVGLAHLAVAEHDAGGAAIRLEDAGAEIDVGDADKDGEEEEHVMHEVCKKQRFRGEVDLEAGAGREPRVEPEHDAREREHDAEEQQGAVGETLGGLHVVLRGHVNLARRKQIEREFHGPGHVVLVPLAEDVLLEEVHEAGGRLQHGEERNEDERNREDAMEHAHGLGELTAHNAAAEARNEHEHTGDREQDAGDGGNAVSHAGEQRVTLNVSGHSESPITCRRLLFQEAP